MRALKSSVSPLGSTSLLLNGPPSGRVATCSPPPCAYHLSQTMSSHGIEKAAPSELAGEACNAAAGATAEAPPPLPRPDSPTSSPQKQTASVHNLLLATSHAEPTPQPAPAPAAAAAAQASEVMTSRLPTQRALCAQAPAEASGQTEPAALAAAGSAWSPNKHQQLQQQHSPQGQGAQSRLVCSQCCVAGSVHKWSIHPITLQPLCVHCANSSQKRRKDQQQVATSAYQQAKEDGWSGRGGVSPSCGPPQQTYSAGEQPLPQLMPPSQPLPLLLPEPARAAQPSLPAQCHLAEPQPLLAHPATA